MEVDRERELFLVGQQDRFMFVLTALSLSIVAFVLRDGPEAVSGTGLIQAGALLMLVGGILPMLVVQLRHDEMHARIHGASPDSRRVRVASSLRRVAGWAIFACLATGAPVLVVGLVLAYGDAPAG